MIQYKSQGEQELVAAARQGDVARVMKLIETGVSVNAVDEFGMTPLMLFAAQGLDDGLRTLLNNSSCLVNKRTSSMMVALHFAAERGNADCVKQLLSRGAVVNVSDDWGETPLIKAAGGQHVDDCRRESVVISLLNNGARTDMIDLHGRDALVHAARTGANRTLRVLLKHGANPNHGPRALALHEAASFGHVECVEALLGAGARMNLRNLHGQLPLELATQMDHVAVVAYLLNYTGEKMSLEAVDSAAVVAVSSNAWACLSALLRFGANCNAVDSRGIPLLHLAVDLGHTDVAALLIQYGARVDRRVTAVSRPDSDLRELCVALGSDSITPLMLAAQRGKECLIRLLVEVGAQLRELVRVLGSSGARRLLPQLTLNSELMQWIREHASTPPTLAHSARQAIRSCFKSHLIDGVYSLPLPHVLQDYVAFADLNSTPRF